MLVAHIEREEHIRTKLYSSYYKKKLQLRITSAFNIFESVEFQCFAFIPEFFEKQFF